MAGDPPGDVGAILGEDQRGPGSGQEPRRIETAVGSQGPASLLDSLLISGLEGAEPHAYCRMESACETCAYFHTGPEFVPVLLRQRDHARNHDQPDRAALFDDLLERVTGTSA